ncbi:dnaJ homolog subfamily C member 2 [Anabrus simplex]|uniref:dnaJ homolog subfamily C member 2 n=1 Tax=Anabrus simplex TaxID=316456 RepID=UPI0035A3A9CC
MGEQTHDVQTCEWHVAQETISGLVRATVQCVGPWFLRSWHGTPATDASDLDLGQSEEAEDEITTVAFDKDDVQFLRSLDPKDWKEQDHYAVLGLKKLRHTATEEDIKKAYRLKVLQHHPDKRRALGEEIRPDDDYFTCITKAWEILGNPRSRRSYDSVDPQFDDTIPTSNEHSKNNFYEVFGRTFQLNSRWSKKLPVPQLGGCNASRAEVEKFYDFWYNFDSWREYSYLDEEEKEKGQAREERRWIEKQNKASRSKRKKEEMARIRTLVDTAYNLDPRIHKFKQDDKNRKLAAKQARRDAARARQEEEERKAQAADEEARRLKAAQEAEEKAKQDALKAERNAVKKALRTQRTALRKKVKDSNYYALEDKELVHHMASLEKVCESFQANELEDLINKLNLDGRDAFLEAIKEADRRIEEERQAHMDVAKQGGGGSNGQGKSKNSCAPWTPEQLQLLIKAVNVFPAGTNQRWEVVANFINQHVNGGNTTRTAKEVLSKAKDLQGSDYSKNILKVTAAQTSLNHIGKDSKNSIPSNTATSERYDDDLAAPSPWTATEQQLLEQALKTYPSTTPERWDKIAACIPSRSKKECMLRFKELAEMVKAKKAAQAAVAAATTAATTAAAAAASTTTGAKVK